MQVFSGPVLTRRDAQPGWIQMERGRVVASGREEPPERPTASGWIIPTPVNAHTHIGDTWLRDRPGKPHSVRELVGPDGWKHQHLARPDAEAMAAGAVRLAEEMAGLGTQTFLDFREGGLAGVRWLRGLDLPVKPFIMGRGADGDTPEAVAALADGIGLSGMRDINMQDLEAWAEAAHAARKPFAVHVSEDAEDDIDAVLALEPSFVVHMTQASESAMEEVAQAGVTVVACPRSNAWFGKRAPMRSLREAGCTVALGTDNGMLQDGDLLAEVRLARRLDPDADMAELLRAMTYHGRDLVGLPDPFPARRGAALDAIVVPQDRLVPQATKPGLDVAPT